MPPAVPVPPPDPADPAAMPAALDAGADPASPPVRARRPVARLDADRLLGIRGLPELVQRARKLRFKGRGNELQDLARIVDMFRIWGAELYPKLGFDSFVDRTERVCRERRLRIHMAQLLRDAEARASGILAAADVTQPQSASLSDPPNGAESPYPERPPQSSQSPRSPVSPLAARAALESSATAYRRRATQIASSDSESDHDDNVFFAAPTKPSAGLTAASEDRLAQIEDKRKQALARLAARQAERDRAQRDKQRAEREALVAAMIDDAGVFDN